MIFCSRGLMSSVLGPLMGKSPNTGTWTELPMVVFAGAAGRLPFPCWLAGQSLSDHWKPGLPLESILHASWL